jgi:hypothetical protein
MLGNGLFSIDMPYGNAHFEANLPDGLYMEKTFHNGFETPIQEFLIGKPSSILPIRFKFIIRTS